MAGRTETGTDHHGRPLSWNKLPPVHLHGYMKNSSKSGTTATATATAGCATTTTPLRVLAQNPLTPADTIAALLELKMEVVFCRYNKGTLCLDYAKECNVNGLVSMIEVLCNHRIRRGGGFAIKG
eukprot:836530-Ditylum_brightwellii.AAC.1